MRRLEIGPEDRPLEGAWDTLDIQGGPNNPTYVAEWGYDCLPIRDGAYDLVFSSHVIEHIPWYQTLDAFKEVYRILVKGGSFEVWTVDFAVVVKAYLEKRAINAEWTCDGRVQHWMQSIAGRVFAYQKAGNPYMWHKALFDRPYLKECLLMSGFERVEDLTKTRGHDHGEMNLGVVAYK